MIGRNHGANHLILKDMINLKKRFLCSFSAMLLIVSPVPVQAEEDHQCGEHITWHYDAASKTLELTGTGDMYDYEDFLGHKVPWAYYDIECVSVADGITSIGDYAFYCCEQLTALSLPDSVRRLGTASFASTGLETVTLHIDELGNQAFSDCHSLRSVVLESGAKQIGDGCFSGDYLLSELMIPNTVQFIGDDAFNGCAAWYQAQTEDFIILGDGILCKYLGDATEIVIPDSVKQICTKVFISPVYLSLSDEQLLSFDQPNTAITKIEIPNTVTELRSGVFQGLSGLQEVTLPAQLTKIGSHAFFGCTNLETISIPKTVRAIGSYAFQDNPWLTDAGDYVILGDGLLYQFQGRQKLLHIPEDVKQVCSGAVSGDQILEIHFPDQTIAFAENAIHCENAVIIGEPNGAAAQYAAKENIPFRSIYEDNRPQGADLTLDYTDDGWYFGNSGKVFGGDYVLNDLDRQRLNELGISTNTDKSWGGSCIGLSVTAILAKNGVFSPAQLQTGAETLSEIEPTDNIVSFINYYQCIQGRDGTSTAYEPDFLKFYRMLNIAKNIPYGESPFLLTFATKNASHAVVGYGQEEGVWTFDGKVYDGRILVWDSNFPSALHQESCLYYDSQTFDYCIPYYGVHVADGASDNTAGIITVCNDLSVLNAYPYPFELHYEPGDINCDGKVSAVDAILLAKHLTAQTNLTESQLLLADISADGTVNAADLTLLKRGLAGK